MSKERDELITRGKLERAIRAARREGYEMLIPILRRMLAYVKRHGPQTRKMIEWGIVGEKSKR